MSNENDRPVTMTDVLRMLEAGRAAAYGAAEPFDHAQPFREMRRAIWELSRLSPPPAPAAEPCKSQERTATRWEAWISRTGKWFVSRYYDDDTIDWLDRESCRFVDNTSKPGDKWAEFPTKPEAEAAARAALAAEKGREQAAEPGVEKPAPASNTAAILSASGPFVKLQHPSGFCGSSVQTLSNSDAAAFVESGVKYIAAALTAAHAAGRAEGDAAGYARGKAEQRAPEGCVINQNSEVLVAEPVHAAPYPFNPRHYTTEWLWRLTKQPADPAAKEAGR